MVWERAFRRGGRRELEGTHRAGRKPRLSAVQLRAVERALLRGPEAAGYRTALSTLPRIAAVIEKRTGVRYHPGHVWCLLHQLG